MLSLIERRLDAVLFFQLPDEIARERLLGRARADDTPEAIYRRLALYLATIAVLPSLFIRYGGFSQATSRALGGTSVLIAVGVALDTMRQMESQMMMRSYEGFLR
jgi:hypothetical protein